MPISAQHSVLMVEFQATLKIIDGNPYVDLPAEILSALFVQAKKSTSPIPIHGTLNGKPYRQTLVKFRVHGDLMSTSSCSTTHRDTLAKW